MKVILCEDVDRIGEIGETKNVSEGFARNFLLPRNLALPATPSNIKRWESERKTRVIRSHQSLKAAQELAGQIEKISVELFARAGREGHLFGSITSQMITDALGKQGFSVDKKDILLEMPIKSLGEHQVSVRLHSQVNVLLKLNVVSSGSADHAGDSPASNTEASN